MSTDYKLQPIVATTGHASLRLAATLLLTGQLLYILVTQFHAGGDANDHPAIFHTYAESQLWTAVHLAQFVCVAILLAGLIALAFAIEVRNVGAVWASRFGAASAVAALALYGMLQAVDGVGNKQVDSAWVHASGTDKGARFASAEAMRWLEWGARSYHDYALGIALLLLGAAILRAERIPRAIGYLVGSSGLAYLVQGWVVGSEGFSGADTTLILVAWGLSLAWMTWLIVLAWRGAAQPQSAGAPPAGQ